MEIKMGLSVVCLLVCALFGVQASAQNRSLNLKYPNYNNYNNNNNFGYYFPNLPNPNPQNQYPQNSQNQYHQNQNPSNSQNQYHQNQNPSNSQNQYHQNQYPQNPPNQYPQKPYSSKPYSSKPYTSKPYTSKPYTSKPYPSTKPPSTQPPSTQPPTTQPPTTQPPTTQPPTTQPPSTQPPSTQSPTTQPPTTQPPTTQPPTTQPPTTQPPTTQPPTTQPPTTQPPTTQPPTTQPPTTESPSTGSPSTQRPGNICDRFTNQVHNRIIGGSDAPVGAYPYQVSIRRSSNNGHTCGGSILNNRWILTAAHCVIGQTPDDLFVVAGTNFQNSGGSSFSSEELVLHPAYNPITFQNDVALIRVSRDITFGPTIQPIALSNERPPATTVALVTGWGFTNAATEQIPNALQQICLRIISNTQCRNTFPDITNSVLCTLNGEGEGVCRGDSGGPLVVNDRQVGIVSFGRACAQGFPDAFASVSEAFFWIQSVAGV